MWITGRNMGNSEHIPLLSRGDALGNVLLENFYSWYHVDVTMTCTIFVDPQGYLIVAMVFPNASGLFQQDNIVNLQELKDLLLTS